jgi:hypothetical protein
VVQSRGLIAARTPWDEAVAVAAAWT